MPEIDDNGINVMKRINICKNKKRKLVRGKLVCAWSQNSKFFIILL
jgi:hypothetical protein